MLHSQDLRGNARQNNDSLPGHAVTRWRTRRAHVVTAGAYSLASLPPCPGTGTCSSLIKKESQLANERIFKELVCCATPRSSQQVQDFLSSLDLLECFEIVNTRMTEKYFCGPYSYGTPLVYAIVSNSVSLVKTLLRFGADQKATPCVVTGPTTTSYQTVILDHLHFALLSFCQPRIVGRLLRCFSIDDYTSFDTKSLGLACMEYVASCQDSNLVAKLLDTFSDVDLVGDFNRTALHLCIAAYNRAAVDVLLQRGADINVVDRLGRTPVMYVAERPVSPEENWNAIDTARRLLDHGADVNQRDCCGWTALHFAVNSRNVDMVEVLLSYGADVCVKTVSGLVPMDNLFVDSAHGKHRSVGPVSPTTKYQVAELLIRQPASWYTFTQKQFCAVILPLVSHGSQECEDALISVVEANSDNLSLRNEHGQSLLHLSALAGRRQLIPWLLNHGFDVHDRDIHGWCAIHYAAVEGDIECMQILLEHGACVNATTVSNWSPLWIMLGNRDSAAAMELISQAHDLELDLYSTMRLSDIRRCAFSETALPLSLFDPVQQRSSPIKYAKEGRKKLTLLQFAGHMKLVQVVELLQQTLRDESSTSTFASSTTGGSGT